MERPLEGVQARTRRQTVAAWGPSEAGRQESPERVPARLHDLLLGCRPRGQVDGFNQGCNVSECITTQREEGKRIESA